MTLAYPIDDNEKAKTTQAPLAGAEHLAKAQEKDAKLEEQKHPEGSASSNDKQQHKPGDIDLHPKPEKPQDSKDQHAQHPEKPSEQTTLVPGHDHQKPHDHNDQIAVPTEEKKEEQKDIELRHLAPEHSSVGSFPPKDASLAAGKLEHGKKDKDEQLHQEKKIEEAILASSGALDKKPDDKAHPESTPATEAKDDQKTTSEHQAITEAPGKAETGEGHGTT
ncbi:hypothetical protein, partial [Shimia sediminis]|uniref:hypothetical protein n=1 Tax=Shimia sediminis TaxID=2497945 RepID=UPI00198156B1